MAATGTTTSTEKGRRIVGAERQTLAKDLVKRYTSGESILALASSTGLSYGFVHRVLTESGVQLRQRGGARRRQKARAADRDHPRGFRDSIRASQAGRDNHAVPARGTPRPDPRDLARAAV